MSSPSAVGRRPLLALVAFAVLAVGVVPVAASAAPDTVHRVASPDDVVALDVSDAGDAVDAIADGPGVVGPSGVVALAGYSRYDDSDPLENDARRRVYDAVVDSPGTYLAELAGTTGVARSTVRYHVRILEEEGLVVGQKIRGKQRYFPAEDDEPELTAALADDAASSVLAAVARLEPASVSALASDLDRAPSTVSYHLSRLDDAGLVEQERDSGAVFTTLADDVRARLVPTDAAELARTASLD